MHALLSQEHIRSCQGRVQVLMEGLGRVLLGQESMMRLVVTAMIARGHVLLEGLPGLGKTELVKGLAALLGLEYKRIQFTPDLLPGDITGNHVLDDTPGARTRLVFRPGPLFGQLVLADEVNRASPKTQSALLEAMQERAVTVFGTTHPLPDPFFVLATQNPVELDGTYPLPEAQLDRFAVKVVVHGIDADVLTRLLLVRAGGPPALPDALLSPADVRELIAAADGVALPEAVAGYIARIAEATRPELADALGVVKDNLRWGASPRAALALAACARSAALIDGRPAVGFADVRRMAAPVLAHRLIRSYEAGLSGTTTDAVVAAVLESVRELPR